jgi:3-hydroxyisobutyrate dehydrogenase-like beta-hydroxyacid dehydrogenase
MTIGLVGAGHMGSGLGAALREGGHDVITDLSGRSARTARLAAAAGVRDVASLTELLARARVVLVVTPPDEALPVARQLATAAASGPARPLIADLNATSPATVGEMVATLAGAGLDLVDGAISGPPPTVAPGARIYLSGARAAEVAGLSWRHVMPIVVGGTAGMASSVKMCTASVYKGYTGILAQALRTASHYGVLEHVLADLAEAGHRPLGPVSMAATKAWRYVPEMREIARTQHGAGQPAALFTAMATVYERLAQTRLAQAAPESARTDLTADEFVALLAPADRAVSTDPAGAAVHRPA